MKRDKCPNEMGHTGRDKCPALHGERNTDMETQHALLWSQRQNALHIEPFETTLSANRIAYRDNKAGDYRVLFVGPMPEVEKAADAIRNTLKQRAGVPA